MASLPRPISTHHGSTFTSDTASAQHQQQQQQQQLSSTPLSLGGVVASESVVPTLRVMRLQSPAINLSKSSSPLHECALQSCLCLPDSLVVYVGEIFTAYLGVLNSSRNESIRRLTVNAQLQTPTQRYQLPSRFDQGNVVSGGMDVPAGTSVDAIVSRLIEECGQHILRVEVSYRDSEAGTKTFRKFYRFQVTTPIRIRHITVRVGDSRCLVSVSVEYTKQEKEKQDALIIASADFEAGEGLTGTLVGNPSLFQSRLRQDDPTAVDLFDQSGYIVPGGSFSYIFSVEATSKEATLRGIAVGDYIGRAVFTWCKTMGERGTIYSDTIHCPRAEPIMDQPGPGNRFTCSNFLMYRSGLSVDVAAAAASQTNSALAAQFPVTVEPIDPPSRMKLNTPVIVQFLIVNHSNHALTLQLQMNLAQMEGLVVCGHSFKNLGEVKAHGGSTVTAIKLLSLRAGLMKVDGCSVVDLASGREIQQPPLFSVFVGNEI